MMRPLGLLLLAAGSLSVAACGRRHAPVAAAPPPDLDARAEQQASASANKGERVGDALRGVAQDADQYTDWNVQLEAGNCYWFGYAGDAGVNKFAMYIWGPTGKRLDSARGKPPQGVFTHCAQDNGIFRVQGKVQEGAGHYAVVVYKTKALAPVTPPPAPEEKKADLTAIIEKAAASAAPGATRTGDFFSGSADTSDWYTNVEAGKCYWFIGAGEPKKVKKLYLYLWDQKNKRITESRSDSDTAMVGHCPKESGMFKFQAKVDSGKGDYKVGVYVK